MATGGIVVLDDVIVESPAQPDLERIKAITLDDEVIGPERHGAVTLDLIDRPRQHDEGEPLNPAKHRAPYSPEQLETIHTGH